MGNLKIVTKNKKKQLCKTESQGEILKTPSLYSMELGSNRLNIFVWTIYLQTI